MTKMIKQKQLLDGSNLFLKEISSRYYGTGYGEYRIYWSKPPHETKAWKFDNLVEAEAKYEALQREALIIMLSGVKEDWVL